MNSHGHFLIVGAGFSGAVLARELAERTGAEAVVLEERDHIAGNCHTGRDPETGVMLHRYGPHIFNTSDKAVWDYVNRFGAMRPFISRVKAVNARGVFSLPVNLHTINQFFGTRLGPKEAEAFIAARADRSIAEPQNFEEQALRMIGRELYDAFFRGYTLKQWGCDPTCLPADILKRLPLRFNYNDNYYDKTWQGIPEDGYSALVARILDHPLIRVETGRPYRPADSEAALHTFYTGPLDRFFGHSLGRLGYRTVTFERIDAEGDFQGNAVINYTDASVPWTRIHEHKHFTPWETHSRTVAFREYSKETEPDETPYYPKRLAGDKRLLRAYRELAQRQTSVSFLGRLATYRYMDMERVIAEALEFAARYVEKRQAGEPLPIFPNSESF